MLPLPHDNLKLPPYGIIMYYNYIGLSWLGVQQVCILSLSPVFGCVQSTACLPYHNLVPLGERSPSWLWVSVIVLAWYFPSEVGSLCVHCSLFTVFLYPRIVLLLGSHVLNMPWALERSETRKWLLSHIPTYSNTPAQSCSRSDSRVGWNLTRLQESFDNEVAEKVPRTDSSRWCDHQNLSEICETSMECDTLMCLDVFSLDLLAGVHPFPPFSSQ